MTVFITENVEIDYGIFDKYYCASSEPQIVAVDIYGDYTSFSWSTSGDGVFEDPNELFTNYTPGPMDIANGVTLYATAQSEGCGPVVFEYNFDMNPLPQMTLATNAIEICEGENAIMNFSISGSAGSWNMFDPEFTFLMNNVQYEVYQSGNNSVDLGVLEVGEHVFRIAWVHNLFCYTNYEGDEMMFTVNVNAAPTMAMGNVPESVCEGEEVNINFGFTGVAPFIVEATGMEGFTAENDTYTLSLNPTETLNATFTKVTDANGCETAFEQAINITVNAIAEQPEISGDAELDVRLTPTTTYTVSNDVEVGFSIEPEEAGTLVPANDGKSVVVTWSNEYKGQAVLTATPIAECNNGSGSLDIEVKNSTDVNEYNLNASIYPNPTDGNVTIKAEGMQRLTVVNELGQVVYDAEVNGDSATLNMSAFGTGVFMVRIYAENGVGVKRVTVIR